MGNEWRDNIWLVIALSIVSLAIWLLLINLWNNIGGMFLPVGADATDVYTLKLEVVPEESPEYTDYGEEREAMEREDRIFLMNSLRRSPNVEAAAWSNNALPYNFSYMGSSIFLEGAEKDTIGYGCNLRSGSPDIARVLRLNSTTGKTPEQLAEYLRQGNLLISEYYGTLNRREAADMLGKKVYSYGDTLDTRRVADIIDIVRRSEYEQPRQSTVVWPIDDENPGNIWDIALRVKPGRGEAFAKEFDSTPAMQQHRNFYLAQLTSMEAMKRDVQKNVEGEARASIALMSIILIVILLGLLGTFWFRVQQRVQEIAIRKVCGASDGDIFRRIIGEGMILLLFASVLAAAVFWVVDKFDLLQSFEIYSTLKVNLWAELATFVIVAIGVSLSLWWPARKAMRIEPAVAIKDE